MYILAYKVKPLLLKNCEAYVHKYIQGSSSSYIFALYFSIPPFPSSWKGYDFCISGKKIPGKFPFKAMHYFVSVLLYF